MFGHSSCSVSSDVSLAGLCASSHDEESGGFDELPADLPPAEIALACKIDDLPADLPFHLGAMFWGGSCYFQI